ncbi:MAG: NUMOD3 domain-containing DNA-binding protein, partial [bacterium]
MYIVRHRISRKAYVGTTVRSVEKRWRDHLNAAFSGRKSSLLHEAIRRDGAELFTVDVVQECQDYETLLEAEKGFIASLGTLDPGGYNIVKGGRGNLGWRWSAETRAKIVAKLRGRPAHNKGVPHTDEAKARMSAARKGKPKTTAQLAAVRKPRVVSVETRRKMSESNRRSQSWLSLVPFRSQMSRPITSETMKLRRAEIRAIVRPWATIARAKCSVET